MRSPQFYAGVVRGILCFSILCHLVGFCAPGWLCLKKTAMIGNFAYRETENLESYGVWFALRCGSDNVGSSSCVPENYYTTDSIYGNRLTFCKYNHRTMTLLWPIMEHRNFHWSTIEQCFLK